MNLRDLQLWLNAKGANLDVDGKKGPKIRAAVIDIFTNKSAAAVTAGNIADIATRLGGTARQVRAVAAVESAGGGWDTAGRLKCLYERHYFWKRWKVKIPLLSDPVAGGYTTDANKNGINDSWEKVADAAMLNPLAAFESASWGKFQIMGAHAEKLGYGNALDFVWQLSRSEAAHYEALARYIEVYGGKAKFQALSTDWRANTAFATFYNGPKQKGYDQRLAEAMR